MDKEPNNNFKAMEKIKEQNMENIKEYLVVDLPIWAENVRIVGYDYLHYHEIENGVVIDCGTIQLPLGRWCTMDDGQKIIDDAMPFMDRDDSKKYIAIESFT